MLSDAKICIRYKFRRARITTNGMITFKDTGTYEIKMINSAIIAGWGDATVYVEINVTKDAMLSNINVSAGELTPAFNKFVFNYHVDVPRDTSEITLTAIANDISTIISGDTGLRQIRIGTNYFTITATSGQTTWTYNIAVKRSFVNIAEATEDLQITNYEVYDILGRLQLSQQSHLSLEKLPFPTGIYIIKMQTNKGIITKKFYRP